MRSCAVCFYFRRASDLGRNGDCVRRSPQVFLAHSHGTDEGDVVHDFVSTWPTVMEGDRCGEFNHKASAKLQQAPEVGVDD